MEWIKAADKSNLKENYPYLVYGNMWGHYPQNDIAVLIKGTWYSYDDPEHYFHDYEIDWYMDVKSINPPEVKEE